MDNNKVVKLTADIIGFVEQDKAMIAVEKIAALKTAASLIEYTVQAESMLHLIDSAFKKI